MAAVLVTGRESKKPGGVKGVYQEGFAKGAEHVDSQRLQKVLDVATAYHASPVRKLLDVGCGDGGFSLRLGGAVAAQALYGIDIAANATALARSIGIHAECLDIDETDLPYLDASFDLIYCGHLVELVLNADHLLKELCRVLTPDGRMIITHPNMGAWASRIALASGRLPFYSRVSTEYDLGKMLSPPRPGRSTGFIRLFTTHAFRQFLAVHGLKARGVWGVGETAIPAVLRPFDAIFSRFPALAFHNVWLVQRA